jgi:putative hydrolase of the HAD superfamily
MNYSAVIFDLFGTLVPDITGPPYERTAGKMAEALSVPSDEFSKMWFDTVYERNIGVFETIRDNIEYICNKMNARINEEQVSRATRIRHDFLKQSMMSPRKHSLETIAELRKMGIKIGLISDCSPSEPDIWKDTFFQPLFDATIFSASAKLKKPDVKIYQLAVKELKVREEECVYVGNGGSNEMEGAYNSGMFPVLVLPEKDAAIYHQPGEDIKEYALTHGKIVNDIREVINLL